MSAYNATAEDDWNIPGAWSGQWSQNSDPRTQNINLFVVHHAADPRDAPTQLDRFMSPNERSVSCTWFMDSDGTPYKVVHPARRQWTTGYTIDQRAVTVETRNTSTDPTWGISRESMDGIAGLVAWAAKTYDFPIDRDHVMGHSEARARFDTSIPATACPGPSMDLDYIVNKANGISVPIVNENVEVEEMWRIIDCPAYQAASQVVLMRGDSCETVPKGWVVDMILQGKVTYATYATNDSMMAEVRMFYFMKNQDMNEAEQMMKNAVSSVIKV